MTTFFATTDIRGSRLVPQAPATASGLAPSHWLCTGDQPVLPLRVDTFSANGRSVTTLFIGRPLHTVSEQQQLLLLWKVARWSLQHMYQRRRSVYWWTVAAAGSDRSWPGPLLSDAPAKGRLLSVAQGQLLLQLGRKFFAGHFNEFTFRIEPPEGPARDLLLLSPRLPAMAGWLAGAYWRAFLQLILRPPLRQAG